MQRIPGGFAFLPWPVILLFAAPVAALLVSFFIVRPARPRWTHVPILASCAVIAACAIWILSLVLFQNWGLDLPLGGWMVAGDWLVSYGVRVDGLSASVLAMVSIVGGLIHVYASGYMAEDPGFARFFLAFHLFFLAMIGLLLSNSYIQLYLFWELVGFASYLLIGFWWQKKTARRAALQAILTNRLGDFGLFLAALILLAVFHNTRFALIFPAIVNGHYALVSLVGFLLFWAATAKSAQFPLYFWLPDAMEGPTPVSALMHAATMVTAGVFLLARSWPLISTVPVLPDLIAVVGAFTAIAAGIVACAKKDLKRILAYSTVSHLGIMVFGLGLGEVAPAVYHLITHGFFKAVLFLCAGNIAHGLHQPTADLDQVGGLRKKMPFTFVCFTVAALSLGGIWPFAGYFSKDAILDAALHRGPWAIVAGVLIGVTSALYIFRMLFLTFFGPSPRQKGGEHIHEAEPVMAVPVGFITLGTLLGGLLGHSFSTVIKSGWPVAQPIAALPEFSWSTFAVGMSAAAVGAGIAWVIAFVNPSFDWEWRTKYPALESALNSDFGWKPFVRLATAGVVALANAAGFFDHAVVDGAVEGAPRVAGAAGEQGRRLATGRINDYVWWMLAGAAVLLLAVMR